MKYLILPLFAFVGCNGTISDSTTPQDYTTPKDTTSHFQIIEPVNKLTAEEFVEKLKGLGYFDYTEKDKVKTVSETLKKNFSEGYFMTEFNEEPPFQSYDLRFYTCSDGEALYEAEGAVSLIREMQPFLLKIGVTIKYSNDVYFGSHHTLDVDGKTYVLAEGSPLLWGETFAKFADMMNTELALANSKERLYIWGDENLLMIFLTKEQYETVIRNFPYRERPLTVNEWTTKTLKEIKKSLSPR